MKDVEVLIEGGSSENGSALDAKADTTLPCVVQHREDHVNVSLHFRGRPIVADDESSVGQVDHHGEFNFLGFLDGSDD